MKRTLIVGIFALFVLVLVAGSFVWVMEWVTEVFKNP